MKKAFQHFCIHTGGRAVLDAMEKNLKLLPQDIAASRYSLWRYHDEDEEEEENELHAVLDDDDEDDREEEGRREKGRKAVELCLMP